MSIQELSKDLIEATKKVLTKEEEYKDFFAKAMKKFGISSPSELSGDKEKEFYDYIDKNWKGKSEDVQEGIFYKEYEDEDEYRRGEEKSYVNAIKKGGGKVGKIYTPDSRDPQLTIDFKGGNIDKIRKEVDKVGDGTEAVEEGYKSQKMQEWISANGERRRVKEGDSRKSKIKVEDVVRDMWETASQEAKRNEAKTPVGKYQTPKLRDESLDEGVKKSKMKIDAKILKDLKTLEKNEKGMNDKEVKFIHDMFKKGVEVESEDGEPAVISNKALKTLDKVWGKLDTFVRDEIYHIMKKHSDEQMAAVLGSYIYG